MNSWNKLGDYETLMKKMERVLQMLLVYWPFHRECFYVTGTLLHFAIAVTVRNLITHEIISIIFEALVCLSLGLTVSKTDSFKKRYRVCTGVNNEIHVYKFLAAAIFLSFSFAAAVEKIISVTSLVANAETVRFWFSFTSQLLIGFMMRLEHVEKLFPVDCQTMD